MKKTSFQVGTRKMGSDVGMLTQFIIYTLGGRSGTINLVVALGTNCRTVAKGWELRIISISSI